MVPSLYLDNIFAHPKNVLSGKPTLDVDCFFAGASPRGDLVLEAELLDGEHTLAKTSKSIRVLAGGDPNSAADPSTAAPVYSSTETVDDPAKQTLSLKEIDGVKLWDIATPNLYTIRPQNRI
ncbi:hypothetical protein RBB78_24575 [Tunturiibacter empetritectus]|uniref:hypothetical protein n=1 Tax=Tunturiibacter empetritectus TaxID=3069691 RepID=UPI003D9BCB3D